MQVTCTDELTTDCIDEFTPAKYGQSVCLWCSSLTYSTFLIFQGPNFGWHIDQYDKLAAYGFCFHGCIDG